MKVAVFGLGYVGTVTAACLAANGHDVWGVDPDESKVAAVSAGHSPVVEPGLDSLLAQSVASGALHATCNPTQALDRADVSILCVGTPSGAGGETNLAFMNRVRGGSHQIICRGGRRLRHFTRSSFVALFHRERSRASPNRLQAPFQDMRLDVGVAMCPEFLREGTGIADFYSPPYTVIGSTDPRAVESVSSLFAFLDSPLRVVHPRTAEALKYACNAFHATKISFANELGRIFGRLSVDTREVMELFCEDSLPEYLTQILAAGICLRRILPSKGPPLAALLGAHRKHRYSAALRDTGKQPLVDQRSNRSSHRGRGPSGRPPRTELQARQRRSP